MLMRQITIPKQINHESKDPEQNNHEAEIRILNGTLNQMLSVMRGMYGRKATQEIPLLNG